MSLVHQAHDAPASPTRHVRRLQTRRPGYVRTGIIPATTQPREKIRAIAPQHALPRTIARAVQKQLEAGQAIVLLDGLDEVPTQAQRVFVRDAVRAFIDCYGQSRFLITCRVLSYQPPEKNAPTCA